MGPRLPSPTVSVLDQHAIDFIIDRSHDVPDLHLMPVGPLTNIASALIKDPTLPARIRQISLMGGSLTFGNVTPAAEFNIWCDPDAAHVVFTSGIPIKMIGLNVTRQVLATRDRRDQIRSMGKATTTHVADMLDFYAHGEGQYSGLDGGAMHDPLAVAALVAPEILTFEPMYVAVELTGTHTAGMTLCDGRRTDPVTFRSYPTLHAPGRRRRDQRHGRRPERRGRGGGGRGSLLGAVPGRTGDVPVGRGPNAMGRAPTTTGAPRHR